MDKKTNYKHNSQKQIPDINFGYINLKYLAISYVHLFAKKHIKQWIKNDHQLPKHIIAYGLTKYSLKIMKYVKKINQNISTGIIVPDIPYLTRPQTKNPLIKLKNKLADKSYSNIINSTRSVDIYFLFSEHMKEFFSQKTKYKVFEGVATDHFDNIVPEKPFLNNEKVVVYIGGLQKQYGINHLLNAFNKITDPTYRLILCGNGNAKDDILLAAKDDSRIIFYGEVSHNRALAIELGATVLINPRLNSSGDFTKYSFPSKNMEYLSSGRPLIAYPLSGIPKEYYPYIFFPDDESEQSLAKKIIEVCEMDETEKTKKGGKEFVLQHKNCYAQAQAILKSFDEL